MAPEPVALSQRPWLLDEPRVVSGEIFSSGIQDGHYVTTYQCGIFLPSLLASQ